MEDNKMLKEGGQSPVIRETVSGRVPLGLLGAILGGLIGAAAWALVGKWGYIVGIIGFLIVWLTFRGYRITKAKLSKPIAIVLIIISLIFVILGDYMSWVLILADEAKVSFMEVIRMTPEWLGEIISDSESLRELLMDLGIGLAFTVWASWTEFKKVIHEAKGINTNEMKPAGDTETEPAASDDLNNTDQ